MGSVQSQIQCEMRLIPAHGKLAVDGYERGKLSKEVVRSTSSEPPRHPRVFPPLWELAVQTQALRPKFQRPPGPRSEGAGSPSHTGTCNARPGPPGDEDSGQAHRLRKTPGRLHHRPGSRLEGRSPDTDMNSIDVGGSGRSPVMKGESACVELHRCCSWCVGGGCG